MAGLSRQDQQVLQIDLLRKTGNDPFAIVKFRASGIDPTSGPIDVYGIADELKAPHDEEFIA